MRRTIFLTTPEARRTAAQCIAESPSDFMVTVQQRTRSLDQNAKFHAICEDLARAGIVWAGKKRTAAEWKVLLVSGHAVATKQGADIVPGLEGEFINLRESTAAMSKARGSSLIEYALAWCATHDVELCEMAV